MLSVLPSDIMACDAISKAFPRHFGVLQGIKSEAGGLGTRLCILFASYPACCQDYTICHFFRLLQSFQFLVTSSCSWSIWTLYRLRQPTRSRLGPTKTQCWLKCKDLCSMVGFLKIVKGRSAAQLEEARVECAGCLCTLGCKSGCSTPGRERVIQELREIHVHVHSSIANMKSLARSCVWWASLDADLYQVSVKSTPRISLVPQPFHICEKEGVVF